MSHDVITDERLAELARDPWLGYGRRAYEAHQRAIGRRADWDGLASEERAAWRAAAVAAIEIEQGVGVNDDGREAWR